MRNIPSWLMVLLLLVVGCRPTQVSSDTSTEVTDSTWTKETPREIEVRIERDTVILEHQIECDSVTNKPKPFTSIIRSGRLTQRVKVDSGGKLEAKSECDSLKKVFQAMDKEIFRLRHEKKETVKTVVKTEYKTRWYDMAARWIASIAIVIIGGYTLYKFNKP